MFLYDFIAVDASFEPASVRLEHGVVGLLTDAAREAIRAGERDAALDDGVGTDPLAVEVGALRHRGEALVVPVALHGDGRHGVFANLEGDLQLAPLTDAASHLSLSASWEELPGGLGRRSDTLASQRTTEAVVRDFLSRVARALTGTRSA